ncbi:MAG: ATP-dependent RNA helicase RhlB [Gammaproteobacteria bacterium]|nr:ATP-dependent RNA helicase RhlB [Gammaproteobacteria bacterium]
MPQKHLTNQTFSELKLDQTLLDGLRDADFERCTPIQAEALPPALAGRDVAGQAQTGTGKTAAFLLATYQYLLRHPCSASRQPTQPRAFILAPTRELAIQIHRDAENLGKYTNYKLGLAYGGTAYEKQRDLLSQGVDILVGTPGRLIDYFKQHIFDLKAVQVVVLDEADRMFDLGFIRDIRYLLRRLPPPDERLNLLFSATLSHRVSELAYEHMNNPQIVKIESDRILVEGVRESIYYPANEEKIRLLIRLLQKTEASRTLVFVNTKHAAEDVFRWLKGNDYSVAVLSGDVPQLKRERLLEMFKSGGISILVATDLAARGLHIENVSHVFNFDLPQDSEDYVHRVGRTARAGTNGDAVSFACERYAFSLADIEEYIGHPIPVKKITDDLLVSPKPPIAREQYPDRADRARGRSKPQGARQKTPAKSTTQKGKHETDTKSPSTPIANESTTIEINSAEHESFPPKKRSTREIPAVG